MRVVAFFVVIAGIGLGAAFGYYQHLIKTGKLDPNASFWDFLTGKASKRQKVVVKERPQGGREKPVVSHDRRETAKQTVGGKVSGKVGGETPKPPKVEVTPKPVVNEALVGRLEHKVKTLYAAAKFLDAQFAAKEMMDAFERFNARSDPRYMWAVRMFKRCRVFALLVSRIKRSPLATEDEIYRMKSLKSGNVFYGRIIREYDRDGEEFVDFERDAGITWRGVPKENLEIKPATRGQFKAWLKRRLAEKERFISKKNDPAAVYIYLVTYAWRYGLDEEVPQLLEEAFSQNGSEVVLDYVLADRDDVDQMKIDLLEGMGRDADAAKLRAVASAATPSILPKTGTQEPAPATQPSNTEPPDRQPPETRPPSPPEHKPAKKQPVSSQPPSIGGLVGSDLERFRKASQMRDEAVRLIGQAINLMAGSRRASLGKKAQGLLRHAISIAITLLRKYPNNKAVTSLQEELQGHIMFVNKMLVTLR